MTTETEKHKFQAEVNEVLSLVVNSLYSHREVFLRELISNASDAIDKLSFEALSMPALLENEKDFRIDIIPDEAKGTLTIRDNGAGMTRAELIENLGTIARSGSKKLMQSLDAAKKKDLSLIGQFGVGFYSAFLVADRVAVISRKAGTDEAWHWESEAKGDFEVRPSARPGRGTDVVLHLKEEAREYLQEWEVRQVVRKYSDFVRWPIRMEVVRKGEKEKERKEWVTLNEARALWTRPKSEITDEQYHEFYKHVGHDWQDPLAWTHFKVEGTHELTGLLFVPSQAPMDLGERKARGVKLFVKRVFIMDDAQEILPEWLRFARGVVDSEDLPLNVSREILQKDATTRFIRKQVAGKVITLLEELAAEGEREVERDGKKVKEQRYLTFWKSFGRVLKEGVYHDAQWREQLAKLLRFHSSHGDGLTGLQEYVDRMPGAQKAIYFVAAENLAAARSSPHLEAVRKHGFEVLYMVDPIDEWIVDVLQKFADKPFTSVAKGDLDLPETEVEKQQREEKQKGLQGVLERVQKALGDKVKEARVTDRLTDSPCCLVAEEHGMSLRQERLLREAGHDLPEQKRILELNPDHPVVKKLAAMTDEQQFAEWTDLLHDQALLAEGVLPDDPGAFAKRIAGLMGR